jgi:hypothetical protein
MIQFFLPLMISSFVFLAIWPVAEFLRAQKVFEAQSQLHPPARPVLMAQPVKVKRK